MRQRFFVLTLILTLFLQPFMSPVAAQSGDEDQAAQIAINATQIYQENFSSLTYKRSVYDTTWDTQLGSLSLAKQDSDSQASPDIVPTANNQYIIAWIDDREGGKNYYAQKIDSSGNRLWADDKRINSGSPGSTNTSPRLAADTQGNVYVVWADNRNGDLDVFVQKIDSNGDIQWINDLPVNRTLAGAQTLPAVAVDAANRAVVVWRTNEVNSLVMAQRLSPAGAPLWPADVQVNQIATNVPADKIDEPVIQADSSGAVAIAWMRYESSTALIGELRVQRLLGDGARAWGSEVLVGTGQAAASYRRPNYSIELDNAGSLYAGWTDQNAINLQKLNMSGVSVWGEKKVYPDTVGFQYNLTMAMAPSGVLVIAWSTNLIAVNDQGDMLFDNMLDLEAEWHNASYSPIRLAVGASNDVYAVWSNDPIWTSGVHDVFVRKIQLDTHEKLPWMAEVSVNDHNGGTASDYPKLVPANEGFYFLWTDVRNGDWSVFLNRLDQQGNLLWPNGILITAPGGSLGGGGIYDLGAFSNGDAVVVAATNGPLLIQRVDSSGNKLISTGIATIGIDPRIAVDHQDNVIVIWNDWDRLYIQKFSPTLQPIWGPILFGTFDDGDRSSTLGNILAIDVDSVNNIIVTWQDRRNYTPTDPNSSDLFAQKISPDGSALWGDGIDVDNGFTWIGAYPAIKVAQDDHAYIGWRNPWNELFLTRLNPQGSADLGFPVMVAGGSMVSIATIGTNGYIGYNRRLQIGGPIMKGYDSAGAPLWPTEMFFSQGNQKTNNLKIASLDNAIYAAWQKEDRQIYLQKSDSSGNLQWPAPVKIAIPFDLYQPTGAADSIIIDSTPDPITQATITGEYQTNGGQVAFYLTNNNGADWVAAEPGVAITFPSTGSELRWKIELTADVIWPRSPVIDTVRIEYSSQATGADDYELDDSCQAARPIALNGAAQQHSFHQPGDADWVWLEVVQGQTYILQTSQTEANADTDFSVFKDCAQPSIGSSDNVYGTDNRFTRTMNYTGRLYLRVTNHDPNKHGAQTGYTLSARLASPAPVVVIVAGHDDNYNLQDNIDYSADLAYRTFVNAGVPKANIRYFGPNPNRDVDSNGLNDDIHALADPTAIRDTIQDWSRSQGVRLGVPFFLYLVDHGYYDQFLANGSGAKITASELDLWLSNLEATSGADQINVVIEACHSGSFIDATAQGPAEISGRNRVIITSTSSALNAYPNEAGGSYFSDAFFTAMGANSDVKTAFERAKQAVQATGRSQMPWLDDNGDGLADGQDGALARARGLSGAYAGNPPVIDVAVVQLEGNTGVLQVQARDDFGIQQVWVQVFEPGFVEPPPTTDPTIPTLNAPIYYLSETGGIYQQSLTLNKIGTYHLVFYARDVESNQAIPYIVFVHIGYPFFIPMTLRN